MQKSIAIRIFFGEQKNSALPRSFIFHDQIRGIIYLESVVPETLAPIHVLDIQEIFLIQHADFFKGAFLDHHKSPDHPVNRLDLIVIEFSF